MKRILVTGFEGYVGSHVVTALRERSVQVVVACRDEKGLSSARSAGLIGSIAPMEDTAALGALAESVEGVAHLAASENPAFLAVNQAAIAAMLDRLDPAAAFVMQGGSMVFGDTGSIAASFPPAFNPPPPLSARAELDRYVLGRADKGPRTHVVYGSFVFGGRGAMIPNILLKAARDTGHSGFPGDGSAIWSAVHVSDWADLMVRILLDGRTAGQPVFAAAQELTMADAAKATAQAFTPALSTGTVSVEEALLRWSFFAPGFAIQQRFDGLRTRQEYGWNPVRRDITEEMATTALATSGSAAVS